MNLERPLEAEELDAIATVRSGDSFGARELVDSGLPYWINFNSFHPWGFKLITNEDGSLTMVGNGSQKITHDSPLAQKRTDAVLTTFQKIDRDPFLWHRLELD